MKSRTIKVDYLTRVEGEGALYVKIKGGEVRDVKLNIFEPPRFFEAFLRKRSYQEVPDITARICGICPVAYQMSSVHAMESILGIKVEGSLRELRRLLYCGEWIESHVLHIYMLHAPDFLGYDSVIHMAKKYPETVKKALELKKIGNEIVSAIGGREIHPINVRVGGFYSVPSKEELKPLESRLKKAAILAEETCEFVSGLKYPRFECEYEFVSLRHSDEYPFNEGRLVSTNGLDIAVSEYENHFEEVHLKHSSALHSVIKGNGNYLTGPLARYNLNYDRLPKKVQSVAKRAGLNEVCKNPFKSIIVRAVETLYACVEALRIIRKYKTPEVPYLEAEPKAGTGYGCTEAPRGILYHMYTIDDQGMITNANIVPPTSQNQKTIEKDIFEFVRKNLKLSDSRLKERCEQIIRNYDPCISCSVHSFNCRIDRE